MSRRPSSVTTKQTEADVLRARLEAGHERIEQAKQVGIDVRSWEDFWIQLLHEYEAACDEVAAAEGDTR